MSTQIQDTIRRVFVAPGCIVCHACEEHCPEVFNVVELVGSMINEGVDPNDFADMVEIAADICPVNVIKVEPIEPPA